MRVLIVDDEVGLRQLMRRMLESAGHTVTEAENGRTALKAFQAQPTDVVVTDIIMPEKEGVETIMELRKLAPQGLRIVAISGGGRMGNMDFLRIARELGADASLPKPFRKEDLLACVDGRSKGPGGPK